MFNSSFENQTKMWKRWQLFHATDFQSLLYPCFTVCRILGTFPYKINASIITMSKLGYILSTFLICVFCISELLSLHKIIISKTINFGEVTDSLESMCFFALGGFTVIITYILSGSRMRVLQTMISLKLPPKSYQKLSKWIHAKDVFTTFFIIIEEWVFYLKYQYPVIMFTVSMYIALLRFHMDMQYVNCVCVLKICFERINDNLVHIQKIVANSEQYVPKLINHTQKNQFLLIELKILRRQHLIVSDAVQMLSAIFSLQLIATTTITFTEIVFQMYSHVIRWQNGLSIILDELFLIDITYELTKLILIVWVCESSKNQAFEISTTVHDVLNHTNDKRIKKEVEEKYNLSRIFFAFAILCTLNLFALLVTFSSSLFCDLTLQLHLFSLQILHRKKTFSTKGFSIDATLLTTMTGSITTYILIFAQFMAISHTCDEKSASNITKIT